MIGIVITIITLISMIAHYEDDEDHGCGGVDGWEVGDHDDEVARKCSDWSPNK